MAGYISVQEDLGMLIRAALFAPACYREWHDTRGRTDAIITT